MGDIAIKPVKPTVENTVDIHNPVALEQAIRRISNRVADGVSVCAQALDDWKTAERKYEAAYADAYKHYGGPAHEKKYHAVLQTQQEREAMDHAEVIYKYTAALARFLEAELSAWQSMLKSVVAMYGAVKA